MLGQGSLEVIGNDTIRYSLASSYWLSIVSMAVVSSLR